MSCFSSLSFALTGQININTANQEKLELLPFTGKVRANAIIQYRKKRGNFTSVEELLSLPEIGQSTYEAMASYIKITGLTTLSDNSDSSPRQMPSVIDIQPNELLLLADQDYFPVLIQHIQQAKQQIDIAMYVFKTSKSPKNKATQLLKALINAQQRGVNVRVFLEKKKQGSLNTYNQATAKRLKKAHINVIFDDIKTTSHQKIVIIDQRWNFIGSHNFTHSALALNHEISLLLDNQKLAMDNINYLNQLGKKKVIYNDK